MKISISHKEGNYKVDLNNPLDISIPLKAGSENVNAWYSAPVKIEPVVMGDWVGEVARGGSVNFRNIFFNPHGNGTHTECAGHISREFISINQCLKNFFFIARLITVSPEVLENGDLVITTSMLESSLKKDFPEAIIIRTLPNDDSKMTRQYSNTNPPYLTEEAALFIHQAGIDHLLIDLPSVDREMDGGKLSAHHTFWQYPHNIQLHRTITEMVYVPNEITDGNYLLNLQIASFENDASPSKPLLFKLE